MYKGVLGHESDKNAFFVVNAQFDAHLFVRYDNSFVELHKNRKEFWGRMLAIFFCFRVLK